MSSKSLFELLTFSSSDKGSKKLTMKNDVAKYSIQSTYPTNHN